VSGTDVRVEIKIGDDDVKPETPEEGGGDRPDK
jgi:hypothetical protein